MSGKERKAQPPHSSFAPAHKKSNTHPQRRTRSNAPNKNANTDKPVSTKVQQKHGTALVDGDKAALIIKSPTHVISTSREGHYGPQHSANVPQSKIIEVTNELLTPPGSITPISSQTTNVLSLTIISEQLSLNQSHQSQQSSTYNEFDSQPQPPHSKASETSDPESVQKL